MVTRLVGSRPAALTQGQVDDLVRGNHQDVAGILRSPRSEPPLDEKGSTGAGSRPVELSAKDMQAVRRSGLAPSQVVNRIAEAEQPEEPAQYKGKASSAPEQITSSPTVNPPGDTGGSGPLKAY